MRLGVLNFLPRHLDELQPAQLRQLRDLGFTGTGLPGADDPASIPTARAAEVGRMFHDAGVDLIEYGRYSTTLIAPDIAVRQRNLDSLREACRVAAAADCPAVIVGAGSHNPRGAWFALCWLKIHPGRAIAQVHAVDRPLPRLESRQRGAIARRAG